MKDSSRTLVCPSCYQEFKSRGNNPTDALILYLNIVLHLQFRHGYTRPLVKRDSSRADGSESFQILPGVFLIFERKK